ncbi:MAG: hypothetical protein QHJ81_13530 [Anaerolineae bacterium]|nr:hypothetical protein [Anaerolineae bacterium]
MRRPHPFASCFLPLASCFLLLLAVGCAGPPTTMPPTAAPTPAVAVPAATVSPTATPTAPLAAAPAAAGRIDLGVPAGDTYDIRNAVVDREHGLLYVLGREGDVSLGGGVLAVVDLAAGQVRTTAPLPAAFGIYGPTPSLALSPDGSRLYLAGGEEPALWVLDTGVAGGDLGAVLATRPGVWSMTLDPAAQRLYVVEGRSDAAPLLRWLDAQTLNEGTTTAVPLPNLPQYVSDVQLAVGAGLRPAPTGQWLYLALPYATSVAAYRTDDLSKAADIPIEQGATVVSLVSDPQHAQVYVLTERHIESEPYTVNEVAVLQGQELAAVWAADEGLPIAQIVSDELSGHVLLVGEAEVRQVDPASGQTVAVTAMPPASPYSVAAAFVWQGGEGKAQTLLYRLTHDGVLAPTFLAVGEGLRPAPTGASITLGIALISAALDEAAGRLYVLDSRGSVHVLDTASLAVTATWPGVLDPGLNVIGHAPLTVAEGRLYVPDWDHDVTVVLDAATGERLATIPKSGQITLDTGRQRLFLSRDGVTLADAATFQVTGSIADTVRQTQLVEPSAWATLYDSASDQLFVTMSNNSPGSSASTWLHVYDGKTLTRQDSPIKTNQQFLSGLAVDGTADRLWLASHTPFSPYAQSLTAFTLDGQAVMQWQGLAGQLFADTPRQRLYVARAGGLFALDMASGDLIGYRSLGESPETLLFERQRQRLYAILYQSADLLVLEAETAPTAVAEPVGTLPAEPIRHLAVDADGTVLAVPESGGLFQLPPDSAVRRSGWLRVGGGLPTTGRPRLLAAPGRPGLLFAFAAEGSGYSYGLFRSADGGRSWRPSSRGLRDFVVWDMALSPRFAEDGTALLAGAAGLLRSTDGGETWASLAQIPANHVALALDDSGSLLFLLLPRDRQAEGYPVYAPTAQGEGVEPIGLIPISGPITALALSPDFAADGLALTATWSEGLWRTWDGGYTWQPAGPPPFIFAPTTTILFSTDFAADRMLYVLIAPSYFGKADSSMLLRSSDGGATWEMLTAGEPLQPRRWQTMAISPPHDGGYDLVIGTADGQVLTLDPSQAAWEPLPQARP